MSVHWQALNDWHLQLSIVADAIDHILREVEDPPGLSATADVVKKRLLELVDTCPFPEHVPLKIRPVSDPDLDLDDFDGSIPADTAGVPAELLAGGRDD